MLLQLTNTDVMAYSVGKCLKTRLSSGMSPRQSVAFFTPIVFITRLLRIGVTFASMGAMEQKHKTRKGNTARSARYEFSTFAPAISLENGVVDFLESHLGANHESNRLQQRQFQRNRTIQSSLAKGKPNRFSLRISPPRFTFENISKACGRIHGQHDSVNQSANFGRDAGSADFQSAWCTSTSNVCQNSQSSRVPSVRSGHSGTTANQSTGRNGSIAHWTLVNDISKRECSAESGSAGRASFSARGIAFLHIKRFISQPQAATSNHIELCKAIRSSFALILNITRKALAEITAGAAIACAMVQPKYEARFL